MTVLSGQDEGTGRHDGVEPVDLAQGLLSPGDRFRHTGEEIDVQVRLGHDTRPDPGAVDRERPVSLGINRQLC